MRRQRLSKPKGDAVKRMRAQAAAERKKRAESAFQRLVDSAELTQIQEFLDAEHKCVDEELRTHASEETLQIRGRNMFKEVSSGGTGCIIWRDSGRKGTKTPNILGKSAQKGPNLLRISDRSMSLLDFPKLCVVGTERAAGGASEVARPGKPTSRYGRSRERGREGHRRGRFRVRSPKTSSAPLRGTCRREHGRGSAFEGAASAFRDDAAGGRAVLLGNRPRTQWRPQGSTVRAREKDHPPALRGSSFSGPQRPAFLLSEISSLPQPEGGDSVDFGRPTSVSQELQKTLERLEREIQAYRQRREPRASSSLDMEDIRSDPSSPQLVVEAFQTPSSSPHSQEENRVAVSDPGHLFSKVLESDDGPLLATMPAMPQPVRCPPPSPPKSFGKLCAKLVDEELLTIKLRTDQSLQDSAVQTLDGPAFSPDVAHGERWGPASLKEHPTATDAAWRYARTGTKCMELPPALLVTAWPDL
eukprot:scaffold7033_cov257-Pinguiococcus_pyrenoidosus.AAC.24